MTGIWGYCDLVLDSPHVQGIKTTNDVRQQALLIHLNPHRNHPADVAKSLRIYGGFLSHGGTPKSSKTLDHGLVLKPMAMVTWGSLILRTPYILYVLCIYLIYIYRYVYTQCQVRVYNPPRRSRSMRRFSPPNNEQRKQNIGFMRFGMGFMRFRMRNALNPLVFQWDSWDLVQEML